jgi:hypothetical protein
VGQALPPANPADHALRNCTDFQSLIPDFKAGRLPESRALLVKDHLHECVACRKIYQGNIATMPMAGSRKSNSTVRWAIAAAVLATGGLSVWIAYDQYGNQTGHAIVQAVNGTLAMNPSLAGHDRAGGRSGTPRRRRDPHREIPAR